MRTVYLMDTANNKWYFIFILLTHCILYALNSGIFRVLYFLMYKSTLYDQICSLKIAPRLIHKQKNGSTKSQGLYKMVPPQLMVENPRKWREGPQQITRLVQDGPPQLMVENPNPGKWQEGPHWFLRTTNKTAPLGATKY